MPCFLAKVGGELVDAPSTVAYWLERLGLLFTIKISYFFIFYRTYSCMYTKTVSSSCFFVTFNFERIHKNIPRRLSLAYTPSLVPPAFEVCCHVELRHILYFYGYSVWLWHCILCQETDSRRVGKTVLGARHTVLPHDSSIDLDAYFGRYKIVTFDSIKPDRKSGV